MLKLVIDTPKLLHRTGLEQREKKPWNTSSKITAQKAVSEARIIYFSKENHREN